MVKKTQPEPENENQSIENTVFVSGIPYDQNEQTISEFFKDCGEIM